MSSQGNMPPVRVRVRNRQQLLAAGEQQRAAITEQAQAPEPFRLEAIYAPPGHDPSKPLPIPPSEVLHTDVALRVRQIARQCPEYVQEFTLRTLHQMLMMRQPVDSIAQRFRVHPRTIWVWIKKLKARHAAEARNFDPTPFFGATINFYKEVAAKGFQVANKAKTVREMRDGLAICLQAQRQLEEFLQRAGLFDVHKFQPKGGEKDRATEGAEELLEMIRDTFGTYELKDTPAEAPKDGDDDDTSGY